MSFTDDWNLIESMTDEKYLPYSDDSPQENPWEDDRLGYRPFAERITGMVLSLDVPNGYVIGLHGPWGSGKSTALNFVQAFINKHNEEITGQAKRLDVIDFRPWMVSGHQDLVAAFFKVLSEALHENKGKLLKQGKRALRAIRAGTDPVLDAAAKIALAVHPFSAGAAAALAGASVLGKKSLTSSVDRWLEEPSLQAAYNTLREKLKERGGRYLIIIDDIDRLEDDDIRSIMQMVKTVGKLPNVTYLLAYDRRIVWAALDKGRPRAPDQPSFAEKIIQQEFELPRSSRRALLRMLDVEIAFLLQGIEGDMRWHDIVASGLHRWIQLPRDVTRLANAVRFSWPAIKGEIDAADLLAMEGLRLFDAPIFAWVQRNRDFLFGEGRFTFSDKNDISDAANAMRSLLTDGMQQQQLRILCTLFPLRADKMSEEKSFLSSRETRSSLMKRRGVGHQPGYDTYFALYPDDDAVSKAKIDDAVTHLGEQAVQVSYLREFMGKRSSTGDPLISDYLEELQFRFMPPNAVIPTRAFLNALFSVGEDMDRFKWLGGILVVPPRAYLASLIRDLLKIWGETQAGLAMIEAFENCNSVAFCCSMYLDRAQEIGRINAESNGLEPLVSADCLDRLGELLLTRLQLAAKSRALRDAPVMGDVVRVWAHLTSPDVPRDWINSGTLENAKFLAKVAEASLGYSTSGKKRHYTFHFPAAPEIYDWQTLLQAARLHAEAADLTDDEKAMITAFRAGLEHTSGPAAVGRGEVVSED